jgi:hypothetical protein
VGYGFVIFCVCRGLWVAIGGCSTIVGFAVACVANGGEMIWVFLEGFAVDCVDLPYYFILFWSLRVWSVSLFLVFGNLDWRFVVSVNFVFVCVWMF